MDSVVASSDVRGVVEQVRSGASFCGLLLADPHERALALEAVLGALLDDETRLVWVGNPLRSPLTIERFLIQIVGPEIDLREERSAADLTSVIAAPVENETRLLIVVQQPETINVETMHLLIQMGWYLNNQAVQVQFMFVGPPSFIVPRLAEPCSLAPLSLSDPNSPAALAEALPSPGRRRDIMPLVVLLLAVTLGAVFSMAPVAQEAMPTADPASPMLHYSHAKPTRPQPGRCPP